MNPVEQEMQLYSLFPIRAAQSPHKSEVSDEILNQKGLSSQQSMNSHASEDQTQNFQPALSIQATLFYMYFLQGIILSMAGTMPYIYRSLPSYDIMAVFSMARLPFSLKFLTAPFIEKYNIVSYGKRKTWIVVAQLSTSLTLFFAASFTTLEYAYAMGLIMFFAMFCICLQDIALDGLAIKELKKPYLASLMQAVGQTCGLIIGSLVLLKLTSEEFAQQLGLSDSICQASTLFRVASALILLPTVLFHFLFKETILPSELVIADTSFKAVVKYYKIFLNTNSRHFRTSIMFLVWVQGLNFFAAGYEYELINAGFSRNTLNTISNVAVIPISIASCYLTPKVESFGILRSMKIILTGNTILCGLILLFFPQNIVLVCFVTLLFDTLNTWMFIVTSMITMSFPVTGVTGMYLTMLACMSNFGAFRAPHTKMLGWFGWRPCSFLGLLFQTVIIMKLNDIYQWVEKGSFDTEYLKVQIQAQEQERKNLNQKTQESHTL